jgi:hypothetical protein
VIDALATGLIIAALLVAAWCLGLVIRDRAVNDLTLGLLALLELALLTQAVLGIVNLVTTDRAVSGVTFAGYLIGSLLILPLAAFWALAERTRWGTAVLIVGCLVIPVMIVRMNQVWDARV